MVKRIASDYDSELDIFHVYLEDIKNGIKGCISIGDFNIDIGNDNKIVGMEVEQASNNLGVSPDILSSPNEVDLIIRKSGNVIFMGVKVIKGEIKAFTNVTTMHNQELIQFAN
ncbi:MAG TPA: DUF2283 domain-containing protein [Candidatus Pacearchaeota archaeon]|nr:DUF2283 domain-containing protein [Candidatus Pacearchaeota archaeon]